MTTNNSRVIVSEPIDKGYSDITLHLPERDKIVFVGRELVQLIDKVDVLEKQNILLRIENKKYEERIEILEDKLNMLIDFLDLKK